MAAKKPLRKLNFDPQSKLFFFETNEECLKRSCERRREAAETLNRSEKVYLDRRQKQVKFNH